MPKYEAVEDVAVIQRPSLGEKVGIVGNLSDMGLTSLVQILCLEERQAALLLERYGETGVIFFVEGEIVHATLGPLAGENAVYQLLSWTDGSFQVKNNVTSPRRTVALSWNHLMMEGMRRIDEGTTMGRTQFHKQEMLSPAEIEYDRLFEHAIIVLLSSLEHSRAQLANKKTKKRPPVALQILIDMVNQVVAFAEKHGLAAESTNSLVRYLGAMEKIVPEARMLNINDNRLAGRVVLLYSNWKGSPNDRQNVFRKVGECLNQLLESYFSLFTGSFRASSMVDQWIETSKVFLVELAKVANEIQF
jgi:hypothetical protein